MSINDRDQQVESLLNRRDFFKRAAILGAVAAGGASLLAACDNKGADSGGGEAPEAKAGGGELSCMSTDGLEPAQISVRESLEYVDKSPKGDQDCTNCMHWKPEGDDECGGCAIVPGPIHPKGWCTGWVAAT